MRGGFSPLAPPPFPLPMVYTVLDTVKVSSQEEVFDGNTDSNVVECEESFCVLYYTQLKVFSNLENSDKIICIKRIKLSIMKIL